MLGKVFISAFFECGMAGEHWAVGATWQRASPTLALLRTEGQVGEKASGCSSRWSGAMVVDFDRGHLGANDALFDDALQARSRIECCVYMEKKKKGK